MDDSLDKKIPETGSDFRKQEDNMFAGAHRFLFRRASQLRKQQTFAEEILWNYLRTKPLGYKFRRQHPFLNFILDFYCHALQLAIEVDGSIHQLEEIKQNDMQRQKQLEEYGLIVLRFNNDDIRLKPEKVTKLIEEYLNLKGKTE